MCGCACTALWWQVNDLEVMQGFVVKQCMTEPYLTVKTLKSNKYSKWLILELHCL